ncbi:hypothetical protein LAZ67_17002170 [Cordylochernes scorpioides]|uniref:Uncharacterized protein n=1 Tax=Cordylochernes scorpioides TaxID=51811 RepID=A0ABY6LDU2_9ARAC|nr:hypothetical protein LAZ67_17002170 [Cordylochernes scorpioides]
MDPVRELMGHTFLEFSYLCYHNPSSAWWVGETAQVRDCPVVRCREPRAATSTLAPLTRQQISPHQVIWALLHPEHATFIEFIFPKNKTILVDFLEEALELAGNVDPVIRKNLITLQADLGS